jgi:hypothetical protein
MKVKIFSRPWSADQEKELENEINAFLAELAPNAVKNTGVNIVAARTDGGEVKSETIITIWYEPASAWTKPRGASFPAATMASGVDE